MTLNAPFASIQTGSFLRNSISQERMINHSCTSLNLLSNRGVTLVILFFSALACMNCNIFFLHESKLLANLTPSHLTCTIYDFIGYIFKNVLFVNFREKVSLFLTALHADKSYKPLRCDPFTRKAQHFTALNVRKFTGVFERRTSNSKQGVKVDFRKFYQYFFKFFQEGSQLFIYQF